MSCNISRFYVSRFYVCTNKEEADGYVTDIPTDEADEYEVTLIAKDADYLRVDL